MTFSELLDAAWELAQAACKDLEVDAGVTVYRYPRPEGGYFQQHRYTISMRNNKDGNYIACVQERTPEHVLARFKQELPAVYSTPQDVVDSIDAHALPRKLPYVARVTVTGWCGEMPLKTPVELSCIPAVGEAMDAPLAGGGTIVTQVSEVEDCGDGWLNIRADVKGIKHLPGLGKEDANATRADGQ